MTFTTLPSQVRMSQSPMQGAVDAVLVSKTPGTASSRCQRVQLFRSHRYKTHTTSCSIIYRTWCMSTETKECKMSSLLTQLETKAWWVGSVGAGGGGLSRLTVIYSRTHSSVSLSVSVCLSLSCSLLASPCFPPAVTLSVSGINQLSYAELIGGWAIWLYSAPLSKDDGATKLANVPPATRQS